jgi:hypothetical protein
MQTPEDPVPDASPVANNRWPRLRIVAGAVAAAAVLGGIVCALSSRSPEVKVGELALAGGHALGQRVEGHSKMQAYRPNWSLHRPIQIDTYSRPAA